MISMDDAERSVDWLRDNASMMARVKAERVYMEQNLKRVKAQEMRKAPGSIASREMEALASEPYLMAMEVLRQTVEAEEQARWFAAHHEAVIEAWRSQESTRRSEGKAYA